MMIRPSGNSDTHRPRPRMSAQGRRAFTLIEMLVTIGIIILVSSMALPFIIPIMRGGKLRHAEDIVKTACLLARSRAIKERREVCVTLL